MRFQIFIVITILTLSFILTGCPSAPTTNNNSATNSANTATTNTNPNGISTPTAKTPVATTNEAPTLKPVFTAYCDAMTKKDEAAIRKAYSAATLKQFEADMKEDGEKSLVKFLEVDQVSNKLCEIRNEKIEGDKAVAEIKTEGLPNGLQVVFVKENGEWKLTNESPEIKSVKESATNSNTATNTAK